MYDWLRSAMPAAAIVVIPAKLIPASSAAAAATPHTAPTDGLLLELSASYTKGDRLDARAGGHAPARIVILEHRRKPKPAQALVRPKVAICVWCAVEHQWEG